MNRNVQISVGERRFVIENIWHDPFARVPHWDWFDVRDLDTGDFLDPTEAASLREEIDRVLASRAVTESFDL